MTWSIPSQQLLDAVPRQPGESATDYVTRVEAARKAVPLNRADASNLGTWQAAVAKATERGCPLWYVEDSFLVHDAARDDVVTITRSAARDLHAYRAADAAATAAGKTLVVVEDA